MYLFIYFLLAASKEMKNQAGNEFSQIIRAKKPNMRPPHVKTQRWRSLAFKS